MNKLSVFALSLAVSATPLAAPIAAQEIVVSPNDPYVESVQSDLNDQLDRAHMSSRSPEFGVTSVRFQAGSDGQPTAISTYRSSGSHMVDSFARRAVSQLTSLKPKASGLKEGQQYQANIIVASSEAHLERLSKKLAREEARRLAAAPQEKTVVALTSFEIPVS